jgi:transmembrane sensor
VSYQYESLFDHIGNMKKEDVKILLKKHENGRATAKERAAVDAWYNQRAAKNIEEPIDKNLLEVQDLMWDHISKQTLPRKTALFNYRNIAAAAAVLIVVGAGVFFYSNHKNSEKPEQKVAYTNDIAPCKNTATLTLASGRKIVLSEAVKGELAKESGVSITKTADGQIIYEINDNTLGKNAPNGINILSTSRGETYRIILPDKSTVWLNAASSLKYPASFASLKSRSVELIGEAYFEVTKDKLHPFIVKSAGQEVEVLGTHFNIKNYPGEETAKTSLMEGAVRIRPITGTHLRKGVLLKPGQQSVLNKENIDISSFDPEEVIAWKNGMFVFNRQDLESIMNQVARWYDIKVDYHDDSIRKQIFDGSVSRFQNISQLLEVLESTGSVHFKLAGRRLIVMK